MTRRLAQACFPAQWGDLGERPPRLVVVKVFGRRVGFSVAVAETEIRKEMKSRRRRETTVRSKGCRLGRFGWTLEMT